MNCQKNVILFTILMLGLSLFVQNGIAAEPYTVHEWGTFTVLQDEAGNPLPGVNINEEALPAFVHRLSPSLLLGNNQLSPFRRRVSKAIAASYPSALMRMETPIIYIYPPKGKSAQSIDIKVQFQGGWISEWYPNANVASPGFDPRHRTLGSLTPKTVGSIEWKNLRIGGEKLPPATDEHVWLAPREVAAPVITTEQGQTERYLFYRGVANIEAPLRVVRDSKKNTLSIQANNSDRNLVQKPLNYHAAWLADIQAGKVAFRKLSNLSSTTENQLLATIPAEFSPEEYKPENMLLLRKSMKQALLEEGLYDDEAEAMLNTWKLSYFQSPGLRLFFTLPRAWTDKVLPLTISEPAKTVRAMIGRIEIVTPQQRSSLKEFANNKISHPTWLNTEIDKLPIATRGTAWDQLSEGTKTMQDLGLRVPVDYQNYLNLGRFREALMLDELAKRPNGPLRTFVGNYQLRF
ncbi:MAG: hypothetical protein COA78_11415 [Blastopirellula sp.]|nr:MAG: hypothetical protein COA78_11415 [Blastopirellula sp.]